MDEEIIANELPAVEGQIVAREDNPMMFGVDIERQVTALEKAVKYGGRLVEARNKLIRMFTYAEDWTTFGEGDKARACLSAAGAMRIADKGNFPIRYFDVKCRKEWIKDKDDTIVGYRYIYEGYAQLYDRVVHALGQYSTRDNLLGKSGGEFKDYREINESYIQQAAHTYFKGNAIKDLLGLKGIPCAEFERLSKEIGQDPSKASTVKHASGTQGGIPQNERDAIDNLKKLLLNLSSAGKVIRYLEETGKYVVEDISPSLSDWASKQHDPYMALASASLKSLTTFKGKDGIVQGFTDFSKLKGKMLSIVCARAGELTDKLNLEETEQ